MAFSFFFSFFSTSHTTLPPCSVLSRVEHQMTEEALLLGAMACRERLPGWCAAPGLFGSDDGSLQRKTKLWSVRIFSDWNSLKSCIQLKAKWLSGAPAAYDYLAILLWCVLLFLNNTNKQKTKCVAAAGRMKRWERACWGGAKIHKCWGFWEQRRAESGKIAGY